MSRVVYIIPGFKGTVSLNRYQQIIKVFKAQNFKIVPVTITWRRRIMSDYVEEFFGQLSHKKNDEVYLFGFSLGAMIAVIAADEIKPKALILCSLSSYFKEDLKYVKKSWKNYVGKNRMNDFKNFSFQDLIEKINCKTILVVGKKEDKTLIKKAKNVHKKVKNSELFIIDAGHDISNKNYKNKIFEISKSL